MEESERNNQEWRRERERGEKKPHIPAKSNSRQNQTRTLLTIFCLFVSLLTKGRKKKGRKKKGRKKKGRKKIGRRKISDLYSYWN